MPKETFLNLATEKREKILQCALDEFEQYDYDLASVNRIVEKSEISKGSFYQYFEDKKDLFKYIMELTVEKKLAFLSPTMTNPFEHDFFVLMKELYLSGLEFAKAHPQYVAIGNRLLRNRDSDIFAEVVGDNLNKSDEFFKLLIQNAMKKGEIRDDLDLDLTSYMITALNLAIVDYYMKTSDNVFSEGLMEPLDKLLNILKDGMRKVE